MKNQKDFGAEPKQKNMQTQNSKKGVDEEKEDAGTGGGKESGVRNLQRDFPETEHPHEYTPPVDKSKSPQSKK